MAKPKQKHTNFFPAAVGGELTRQDRRNTDGKSDRWGRREQPRLKMNLWEDSPPVPGFQTNPAPRYSIVHNNPFLFLIYWMLKEEVAYNFIQETL